MASRGEVWDVEFTARGGKAGKVRPCVVVSPDLVVPIEDWQEEFASRRGFVKLAPGRHAPVPRMSATNASQGKSIAVQRFVRRRGVVTDKKFGAIMASMVKRGEVWDIEFTGTCDETPKIRPCIVVSSDIIGILRLRVVVPLVSWQDDFSSHRWFVKIDPTDRNGLSEVSGADSLRVKSISVNRFINWRGTVTAEELEDVVAALALVVEVS